MDPSSSEREPKEHDLSIGAFLAIAVTFVVLAGSSSFLFPIFESPDECWHFEYAQRIAQGQGLPDQTDPTRPIPTGFHPPASYLLPAAILAGMDPEGGEAISKLPTRLWFEKEEMLALAKRNDTIPPLNPNFALLGQGKDKILFEHPRQGPFAPGVLWTVHIMRFSSVLYGAVTLLAVYFLARLAMPRRPLGQLFCLAVIAFNPKFVHLSGALTDDTLVATFAALGLWQLARLLKQKTVSIPELVLLGTTLGCGILAKPNILALIPPTVLVLWVRRTSVRTFLRNLVLVGALVFAVAGWFYIRNAYLYGNLDFVGFELRTQQWPRFVVPTEGQEREEYFREFFPTVFHSFWDRFGWDQITMPAWQNALYCCLTVLAALSYRTILPGANKFADRRIAILLFGALGMNLLAMISFGMRFVGNQGRFLYPSLAAFGILAGIGIEILLENLPRRTKELTVVVGVIGLALLVVFAQTFVIRPYYFD